MPLSDEELLSFETPIEKAFVSMLESKSLAACESRSTASAETPWIEVLLSTGAVTGHGRRILNGKLDGNLAVVYDAWESKLDFTVRTNRSADGSNPQFRQHKQILGIVRTLMRLPTLRVQWGALEISTLYSIQDIRETGSSLAVDEDNNLDITIMSFTLKHAIQPNAWAQ